MNGVGEGELRVHIASVAGYRGHLVLVHCPQGLENKKWASSCLLMEPGRQCVVDLGFGAETNELSRFVVVEDGQRDSQRGCRRVQVAQRFPQFGSLTSRPAPVGQTQNEVAFIQTVGQVADGGDSVGVGPVKVVEHD